MCRSMRLLRFILPLLLIAATSGLLRADDGEMSLEGKVDVEEVLFRHIGDSF